MNTILLRFLLMGIKKFKIKLIDPSQNKPDMP